MNTNLVEKLGADYIRQMCVGALFRLGDDEIHMLRNIRESGYITDMITLSSQTRRWKSTEVPLDKLTSLSNFSYPKLGYRNLLSPSQGHIVVNLTNRRSAYRGLRMDHLVVEYLPVYSAVIPVLYEAWHVMDDATRARAIYSPTFVSFPVGIKQLLEGETLAFAISEDIAVVLSGAIRGDRVADIRFKDRVVGNVNSDGNVSMSNKILQRTSLREHFTK